MIQPFTISSRVAAGVLVKLCLAKLSPVALAARRHERAFARVFLDAIHDAQDAVPMAALIDMLSMGHPGTGGPIYVMQPVIDLLLEETHLTTDPMPYMRMLARKTRTLVDLYQAALKSGALAKSLPNFSFDTTNVLARDWAQRQAAKLVVEVTRESREMIRTLVVAGFDNKVPPRETARFIRSSIGLTSKDAKAVINKYTELVEQGNSLAKAAKQSKAYANKLTRRRAMTIARTETMKAANEGQRQLWEQAKAEGLLVGTEKKTWITANPCPLCAPLEGETVGINESFSVGQDPPLHPNCRCSIGMVA